MLVLAPLLFLAGGLPAMLLRTALLLAATAAVSLVLAFRLRRACVECRPPARAAVDLADTFRIFGNEPRAHRALRCPVDMRGRQHTKHLEEEDRGPSRGTDCANNGSGEGSEHVAQAVPRRRRSLSIRCDLTPAV
jgi:hypothetical protein